MSIRNNYPTVNPTLDLDFANTRRLDPRVTFSRSSTATYYDGSKALAEQNLLLNSQTFNTTWVASSITFATGITDPLGTTTAYTATASGANATVYQSVIIPADTFTFSIYIQRVTGTGTINLTLDGTTMTVASVTGSWVRYTATQTLTAGTYTVGIQIVTSGDAVNIWGAQLEQRSSASAYNVTTTSIVANYISVLKTAAINQPRFDVDPITGESKGLLIEEARTNLLFFSEDASSWNNPSGVIANTNIAPDGALSADTIINPASSASHNGANVSISESVTYTLSRYFSKQSTCDWIRLRVSTAGGAASAFANIATKTTGAIIGAFGSSFTFTDLGNYLRVSITYTPAVGDGGLRSFIWCPVSANNTATAATDKSMIVWGAQVEAGAFPTSYFPTTNGQGVRWADNASMTGTAFSSWYNQSEGTIAVEVDYSSISTYSTVFDINDGDDPAAYRIRMIGWNNGTDRTLNVKVNNVDQVNFANTNTIGSQKYAVCYKLNDFAAAKRGNITNIATSGLIPNVNRMQLGSYNLTQFYLNGHIKSIRYYPARVTNAQLQALTSI